ncbi:MAG: sterol desaturase family protein [Acidobacteria bacterium]|nr:sterol desaturase family protein [Acidobacteriota bacterium]
MKRLHWAAPCVFGVVLAALSVAERRRPLRRRVEARPLHRAARNATMGVTALVASAAVEWAIVRSAGAWAARNRVGLLHHVRMPARVKEVVGFLALDYSIYLWHIVNHRVPGLWRFHLVHHVDRELDVSTGVRFHFGEMALTVALRVAQILGIGVDRQTLALWQRLLTLSVVFHHSNLRLPIGLERPLSRLIVTPRLHGVHHSERKDESGSNFASLLSVWDVLHGTWRVNVPQRAITIGVPGQRDPRELTIGPLLTMPFRPQRPAWPDGDQPTPRLLPLPPTTLAE